MASIERTSVFSIDANSFEIGFFNFKFNKKSDKEGIALAAAVAFIYNCTL